MPEDRRSDESLYDAYLDACLAGRAPSPDAFLEEHGSASDDCRRRIEAAYALAKAKDDGASSGDVPLERLGGYRLIRRLAVGGMGSVYLAEQESLGRTVALKVIRSDLRASETIRRRFEREAQAVAKLRHRNVVNVHEFGRDGDWDFIAMELVPGQPLDEVLRDDAPSREKILSWGVQLAEALAYAHEQGIVHRDVKPQNIMITPTGRPVLLDFGLAHLTGTQATRLTTGFAGTPQYAAPEQLMDDGDLVSGRTDIYALGVTLYESLSGAMPFEGGRLDELLLRIMREEPKPLRRANPEIPVDVETVVLKMLEKDPSRRYATGWAAAEDLKRLLDTQPIEARRPSAFTTFRKWCRRRPVAATMLGALLLAAITFGALSIRDVLVDRERAGDRVALAREVIVDLRRSRLDIRPVAQALRQQERVLGTHWQAPSAMAALDKNRDAVEQHRRAWEAGAFRVLELLGEAERLHGDVAGLDEVRAALFIERMEAARTAGDAPVEAHYRDQLTRVDPEGTTRAALESKGTIRVTTTPPGAELHVFRFRSLRELRPGAERRLVPVPVLPPGMSLPPGIEPGAHVLRVVHGALNVRAGDLILSILGRDVQGQVVAADDGEVIRRGDTLVRADDAPVQSLWDVDAARLEEVRSLTYEHGGVPYEVLAADRDVAFTDAQGLAEQGGVTASVFSDGNVVRVVLPKGLIVRPTAAPRYLLPEATLGTKPLRLPAGSYVLVLRKPGFEAAVLTVPLGPGDVVSHQVALLPEGTTPRGFVFVPGDAGVGDGTARPEGDHAFWIQERELTLGEFLPFLNDRAGWKSSGAVPGYENVLDRSYRAPYANRLTEQRLVLPLMDGAFQLAAEHLRHLPVRSITWNEAAAFARWRSQRDGRVYAIPSLSEWMRASGNDGRRFPFGNDYRPAWVRCLVSRPGPLGHHEFESPRRYPVDESPLGVYAMAGNVAEWLDQAWGEASVGLKHYTGGSAADARQGLFLLGAGRGAPRDLALPWVGFRLALRSLSPGR